MKTLTKLLLLLTIIMVTTSCGSRKRAMDKTSEKTELSVKSETELSVKKDVQKEAEAAVIINEQAQEQEKDFSGEVADPTKPAEVKTETKDGITTQTFTNFKNVKNSSKNASNNTNTNAHTKQSENDRSQIDLTQKLQVKAKQDKEAKTVEVERKTGFPWWLWVIAALVAFGYIYYSKIKRTYNPLNWFKNSHAARL